jgi:DNA primase
MANKWHPFDVLSYLADLGVDVHEAGSPNVSRGWIGTNCPFCGDTKSHLGINLTSKKFSCWRCGTTGGPMKMVMVMSGLRYEEAKNLVRDYASGEIPEEVVEINTDQIVIPQWFIPVGPKFNPEIIQKYFKVRNFSQQLYMSKKLMWSGIVDYLKYRVVVPVYEGGMMVNFVARAVAGQKPNYYSCPNEKAVRNLNHTLYGYDKVPMGVDLFVVEGVFDQWRIAQFAHCVASFGTVLTPEQALLLRYKRPRRLIFLYDSDVDDIRSEQAVRKIWSHQVDVYVLKEGDPADLPDSVAKTIVEGILKK